MARSYKKNHCTKGHYRLMKRRANKRVRQRLKDLDVMLYGNQYRRVTESCDVYDWKEFCSSFEAWFMRWDKFWCHWLKAYGEPLLEYSELQELYKKLFIRK